MGASNAATAYARWAHLPHVPFRLLVFMALVSLDADPQPRYWGGREALAEALGRVLPPEPAASDSSARAEEFRKQRRADFEAVKSALRVLFNAGVVVVLVNSAPGRQAVYGLNLNAVTGKAEPVERGRLSLSTGKAEPVDGEGSPYPRGTIEEPRGTGEEPNPAQVTASRASEITYAEANSILQALPDLGSAFLSRTPESESLSTRVVMAALMVIAERTPA